jgi:hypothetical protein
MALCASFVSQAARQSRPSNSLSLDAGSKRQPHHPQTALRATDANRPKHANPAMKDLTPAAISPDRGQPI